MKKICILDYGLGNIRSLSNALKKIKLNVIMHSDLKDQDFDALIIPGVGSFAKAMSLINQKYKKFIFKAKKEDKLIIGICLGMHLFFSKGYEDGTNNGLGFFRGTVKKIKKNMLKLPNIGWRKVTFKNKKIKNFKSSNNKKFYFVHSFQVLPKDNKDIYASINYDENKVVSVVAKENVFGVQFHPEKSRTAGLLFLKNLIKSHFNEKK